MLNPYSAPIDQAWLRFWIGVHNRNWNASALAKYLTEEKLDTKPIPFHKNAKSLSREVGDMADMFLSSILGCEYDEDYHNDKISKKEAGHTEGTQHLANCDFHLVCNLAEKMNGKDGFFLLENKNADQLEDSWPIDIACAVWKGYETDSDGDDEDGRYFKLHRLSSISQSEARGYCNIYPPKMAAYIDGHLMVDEKLWFAETHIVGLMGTNWKQIEKENVSSKYFRVLSQKFKDDLDVSVKILISLKKREYHSWHVAFGDPNGARAVLPTNPRGCLELFKNRELTSGEKRRAALKHWVNEHYRNRSGSDDYDYIRHHLRGKTNFVWNGIQCEILVSQYDLEKNEFFKNQAAEWRAMRKHNSIKFRVKNIKGKGK